MFTREYLLTKQFHDNDKFPYGISRSGDFSIEECDFLVSKGALYKALFENNLVDPTEEEERLIKVFNGEEDAVTFEEKTWLKYMNYKKRTPIWLIDTPTTSDDSDDDDYIDDDDDVGVDMDD